MRNLPAAGSPLIGAINVELYLTGEGIIASYGFDGIDKATALGQLIRVTDRIREELKAGWDNCPACGEPWEAHDPDYEEEDDDDEDEKEIGA